MSWSWSKALKAVGGVAAGATGLGALTAAASLVDDLDFGPRKRKPVAKPASAPAPGGMCQHKIEIVVRTADNSTISVSPTKAVI